MSVKLTKGAAAPEGAVAPKESPQSIAEKKPSELKAVMMAINKSKPNVLYVGSSIPQVRRLATGVFEFDYATGGGFPRGRMSIVYGPESSGKSNICYCAAAVAQRLPESCNKVVWVDLEGTFDPKWARCFGIDTDKLVIVKPGYGEEAVDLCDALVRADDVALLVVDSIATMVSSKEVGQSVETMDVQGISTLVKRLVNKFAIALSQESKRGHDPAIIMINQTRFKIGVMFGDPETMPGGQTMKFLSSLTVRLYGKNKIDKNVDANKVIFKETKMVIKKAKVPVNKVDTDYDLCMVAHGDLQVGQTNSFGTVKTMLQNAGLLVKHPKGWELQGVVYPKLEVLQEAYLSEPQFTVMLQDLATKSMSADGILVEAAPEAPYTGPKSLSELGIEVLNF
jgi:recombination protein RecA